MTNDRSLDRVSPPARVGLAPEHARVWLALQTALAWQPETIGPLLRAGRSPESILREVGSTTLPLPLGRTGEEEPVDPVRGEDRLTRLGVRVVPLLDPSYPDALRALDDAPLVLVVRGDPEHLSRPAIAIVGARAATRSARSFARRLAYDLARAGFTIVSGLARGIDAEAHRGALDAGGSTIGVLACGIDRIYPPEHRGLADEILRTGAIVSELPLGALPRQLHFPLRNRIISGLSRAVVVVEARRRSGSLITVGHALAQGREVFVVPGAVDGPFAAGTNQLLREGARAIQSARDLLDDLGVQLGIEVDAEPAAANRSRRSGRRTAPQAVRKRRRSSPSELLSSWPRDLGRRIRCSSTRDSTRDGWRRLSSSWSSPVASRRSATAASISVVPRKIESRARLRYSARHPRKTCSRKRPAFSARAANGRGRRANARSRAEQRSTR